MAIECRPALAVPCGRDRRLSEALRLRVHSDIPPCPGGLLGLELEFSVRSVRGGQVHFGSLIHRLALDGSTLDPGDPNAYRCSWGGVITSDGAEAEIATPPVRTRPGFTARLQGWARTGEAELRRAVPRGIELDGYSAHFSAAMPAKLNDRVCRLYAETFAADLMLLIDRIDSPGLLVRPRPGRTELCGEFVQHEPLAAAAAFVAGSTRACAAAVRRQGPPAALPPRLNVHLAPAVQRYGWYVDRAAFGSDLHAAGRRALLPRASGGTICAQTHLELAWRAAREALADDAAPSDLCAAEAMVIGSLPLPSEQSRSDNAPGSQHAFHPDGAVVSNTPLLCAHSRPGFTVRPVAATWDFAVFEATGPARSAYACIPRDSLSTFAAALEEGALDDTITAYLAISTRRRVLSASRQTTRPGLYDRVGEPAELLAPERDPQTGRRQSGGPEAKQSLARVGKRNRRQQHERAAPRKAPRNTNRFLVRAAAIAAAATFVVAAAGVATALLTHRHSGTNGKPPGVSFQPSGLVYPDVQVNASIARSFAMTNNGKGPAMITRISISGPGRNDFSILAPTLLAAVRGYDQADHPAVQPQSCHRRVPRGQTCTITVAFSPVAPGSHTADLRIYFASARRPQDITLRGTGTTTRQRPSSEVSVTHVSPAAGTTKGGTSVTITGTGFTAAEADTAVSFGDAAAQFTIDSATQITTTSPPGIGTVHITVTTPAGTSAAATANQYSYTQSATATTTTIASSANPSVTGQVVTYTATVSPLPDGGTVTFTDGGTSITGCVAEPVDVTNGTATCQQTYPSQGTHSISAAYSGDPAYKGSSYALTQNVGPAAITTTTALTSSPNPSVTGQVVTYTAAVTPVPDGGTVTFTDGGTPIPGCTEALDVSSGTAVCQVTYYSQGTHSITVSYPGDTMYQGSASSLTQTVDLPLQ